MNRRKPIYLMMSCGLAVIFAIAFIPHFIRARTNFERLLSTTIVEAAPKRDRTPSFDVSAWYAARGESLEGHGVAIETVSGHRVLASLNADTTFNPASLLKLATSLVALKKLGGDYRFQTQVYIDGDPRGGVTLFVKGNDPTFGDAAASIIAEELRARGIERIDAVVVSPGFNFNFSNSAEESGGRLAKALKRGAPRTSVADGSGGKLLLVLKSNPLSDILLYMNARSSNPMAEKIGQLIGGASGVQQFLIDELKLPANEVSIETVSGREHNRMTPRDLLIVIRALIDEAARQGLQPSDIMPVASDDAGTLRRRLAGTGLEGAVVAKTGTLTSEVDGGMASLAGIVYTEDEGMILFAIMDQGNRIWDNRQLEDQLLAEVVTTHAKPRIIAGPTPRRLLPAANVVVGER